MMDTNIRNTEFFKNLISRNKDYIKLLGVLLDCPMVSNLNKDAMAIALTDYILYHSGEWMRMLSVREITLVEELLKHKPGYRYKAGVVPFPTAIEGLRLIYAETDKDDITSYWASEELLGIYRRGIKEAKLFIEQHNFMEYEMFATGALNIYGVMNSGSFFEIMMKAQIPIEAKNKIDGRENTDPDPMIFMSTALLCRLYQYKYDGKMYNFYPGMPSPERHIKEQLSRKEIKEYKPFPMEEILDAGRYTPLCSAGMDLPQSKELLSALLNKVKKDIKNEWKSSFLDVLEYHDLFIAVQEDTHHLTEIISHGTQFNSFEEVQSIVSKLMVFSNAIPRWDLKGWSSDEIFKKHEQPHLGPLPSQRFTREAFVPKVGRNDPCPCGSGKKYKECHGKFTS